MQRTVADVLSQLVAEGLTSGESVERARAAFQGAADTTPPWYARVIAGFGAWIATGCLVGFLVIADIVENEMGAIAVGAILVVAAAWLRRAASPAEDFKRQFSLAASLAGQVLVLVGARAATESTTVAAVIAVVMSVALIMLVPDPAHRFMSALLGSIGLIATMATFKLAWELGSLGPLGTLVIRGSDFAAAALIALAAYVWRVKLGDRSAERDEMLEPVGYGTITALLIMLVFSSWFVVLEDFTRGQRSGASAWTLGLGTTIALAIALSALMLSILHELRATGVTAATPIALALLTLSTPGITAAVTLLVLGFDRRNRILIGLAVGFLIKFVSMYYYTLRMTLLEKSVVLVASGLLLLAGRVYLELRYKPSEGPA